MKNSSGILLGYVLAFLVLAAPCLSQTPELASVRVYTYHGEDKYPDATGSGWLIRNDKVVTAYHVVHGAREDDPVMIRFVDGYKSQGVIEAIDKEKDIALIWIFPHETITKIPMGEIPDSGTSITVHGFGYDYEYRTHTGPLIGKRYKSESQEYNSGCNNVIPDENGPLDLLYALSLHGDSGGPVTHEGKVIGTVISICRGYSFFCHIEAIKEAFKGKLR